MNTCTKEVPANLGHGYTGKKGKFWEGVRKDFLEKESLIGKEDLGWRKTGESFPSMREHQTSAPSLDFYHFTSKYSIESPSCF